MAQARFSNPSVGETACFIGDVTTPNSREHEFSFDSHIPFGKGVDGYVTSLLDPSPKEAQTFALPLSPKEYVAFVSSAGPKASSISKGKMIAWSTPSQSYTSPPILHVSTRQMLDSMSGGAPDPHQTIVDKVTTTMFSPSSPLEESDEDMSSSEKTMVVCLSMNSLKNLMTL